MSAALRRPDDADWYTPPDLPAALRAWDTPLDAPAVGSAGKVGVLELELAPRGDRTRVVRQYQQLPLYFFRPLHVDAGWPAMAFVYMLQSGEGIVQGDRYRLELHCAPGSAVHFTSQAATKIYRMDRNFATQIVNLSAGAGAFVEYLPDPVIPFCDARYYQRTQLIIDADATLIYGETLLPGRVARGELHAYALYHTDTEARRPDGTLLFADRLQLAPATASPHSPGLLGGHEVLATLYVVSGRVSPGALVERLRDAVAGQSQVLAGVSELPNGCGALLRTLGPSSGVVCSALRLAWNAARLALAGVPAPDLRKC